MHFSVWIPQILVANFSFHVEHHAALDRSRSRYFPQKLHIVQCITEYQVFATTIIRGIMIIISVRLPLFRPSRVCARYNGYLCGAKERKRVVRDRRSAVKSRDISSRTPNGVLVSADLFT